MLYRFKLGKKSGVCSTLIWRYQSASNVTSMAQIGCNIVVAGTAYGQLCLLDWTKYSKERSFSNDHRPIILRRFVPHDALQAPREDILLGKRMGILKLKVLSTNTACKVGNKQWGRCQISWVTQCGWLLSMILESPTILGACRVVHATPKTIYKSADGTIINTGKQNWSLPQSSFGVCLSDEVIGIVDVPAVTKVLSHHDKFVLDSQPNVVRSKKRSLTLYSRQGWKKIPFPKTITDVPQTVTVHPSCEWMVAAEGCRLHVLSNR